MIAKGNNQWIILFFFIEHSGTGNTIVKAVKVLKDHNVMEENIILANLFCTPSASQAIVTAFPQVEYYSAF